MENVECGVQSVECKVFLARNMLKVKCQVSSVKRKVACEVWRAECGVQIVECKVYSVERQAVNSVECGV